MTAIPLPWLISIFALLIAAMVLSQPRTPVGARIFFTAGLVAIATVTGFVGLRLGYQLDALAVAQPYFAVLSAPALWLGFCALTTQDGWPGRRRLALHGAIVLAAEIAIAIPLPWFADGVLVVVNAVYLSLLAGMLRLGAEGFVQIAPENVRSTRIALAATIAFLALVLLTDGLIVVAALSAGDTGAMRFLSGASGIVAAAVLLGALIGIPLALGQGSFEPGNGPATMPPDDGDHAVLAQLKGLMADSRIYQDPGLTLARLGRRLGCPARSISSAVNRITGESVTRFINGFRVQHAAQLLETTDLPVTEVMLDAGFLSKSSFNSEFRRVLGKTPSEYRKAFGA